VNTDPATQWRVRLRAELLTARKSRDTVRITVLRTALSAIDNAETPGAIELDATAGGTIAGAAAGLGAAEVDRRVLSEAEIRGLLQTEVDERLAAARRVEAGGHAERAAALRTEATLLTDLIGDV
jgi:uncharacterized protein YqeY